MNNINIEALLNTLTPMNFTAQSGAPKTDGSTDGLFLSLLQSFAGGLGGEAQTETGGTSPGNWLATLFGLFAPDGAPDNLLPTPDSTGEASDGTDETVSLTNMMAAIQALAAENLPGTLTAEQVMQAFGQAAETPSVAPDDSSPQKSLDAIAAELGLAQNPALIAALAQLQQNAAEPAAQTGTETGSSPAAVTPNTDTLPPTIAAAPAADTIPAGSTPTQMPPIGTTTAEDGNANTANVPQPKSAAAMPTGGAKPDTAAAATFVKTLTAAQNGQPSAAQPAQPPLAAQPAAAAVTPAHTETTSGEKTAALPADVPTIAAAQPSAAQPVFAPPTVDAPAAPTLPNIPALHQLVDSISVLKQSGQTTVRLQLHPASLGQVLVQMHVHNGDVTVQMLAETSKAQSLIQNHLPELKAAFSAQGVSTGALNVSVGSDASAFAAPRRQTFYRQNNGNAAAPAAHDEITDVSSAPRPATRHYPAGRIDYHV